MQKIFFWRQPEERLDAWERLHACPRCGSVFSEQEPIVLTAAMFRYSIEAFYDTAATVSFEWPGGKERFVAVTISGNSTQERNELLLAWLEEEADRVFTHAGYPLWRFYPAF